MSERNRLLLAAREAETGEAEVQSPRVRIVVTPMESMSLGAMMRGRGGPIRKGIQGSSGRAFAAAGERTLDDVAREYGVAAATLERWRSVALVPAERYYYYGWPDAKA